MPTTKYGKITWLLDLNDEDLVLEESNDGGSSWTTVSTWSPSQDLMYMDRISTLGALRDIEAQFTSDSVNGTYTFTTVSGADIRDDFRLSLETYTGVGYQFRISSNGNMLRYLGADTPAGYLYSSSDVVEFPNHYKGALVLPSLRHYHDERERPQQEATVVRTNDDSVYIARRNSRRKRRLQALAVHGSLIMKDRIESSAMRGDLTQYDDFASFEYFWEEVIRNGKKFRYYHDIDPAVLDPVDWGYYTLRVVDEPTINSMWKAVRDRLGDMGEEHYDIDFLAKELSYKSPTSTIAQAIQMQSLDLGLTLPNPSVDLGPAPQTVQMQSLDLGLTLPNPSVSASEYPQVRSTSTDAGLGDGFWQLQYPSGVQSGDLLIVCSVVSGDDANPVYGDNEPTGWEAWRVATSPGPWLTVAVGIMDGTESGTIGWTLGGGNGVDHHAACAYLIEAGTWFGSLGSSYTSKIGVAVWFDDGSTSQPDPPSLSPGWGAEDILWIATAGVEYSDTDVSAPEDYTDLLTDENGSTTLGAGATIAAAQRELAATSEDPNGFNDFEGGGDWAAMTIAVRP